MDIQNYRKTANPAEARKLLSRGCKVGVKQLKKALAAGTVQAVFLAMDADPDLTEPLENQCEANGIPCAWLPTMVELGKACGIEVGAAAAAVVPS